MIKINNQPNLLEVEHLLDSLSVVVRALGLSIRFIPAPTPWSLGGTYLIIEEFVKLPRPIHHQVIGEEDASLGAAWLCHGGCVVEEEGRYEM